MSYLFNNYLTQLKQLVLLINFKYMFIPPYEIGKASKKQKKGRFQRAETSPCTFYITFS